MTYYSDWVSGLRYLQGDAVVKKALHYLCTDATCATVDPTAAGTNPWKLFNAANAASWKMYDINVNNEFDAPVENLNGFNTGVICKPDTYTTALNFGDRVCDAGTAPLAVRICNQTSCAKNFDAGWKGLPLTREDGYTSIQTIS